MPDRRATLRLRLRPLLGSDAERDYDAVMSSAPELRAWSQSSWPADDFTLAENRSDLERHEREHLERVAFTYTVLEPAGERCVGCVYMKPPAPALAAAVGDARWPVDVGFWVRTSEVVASLDQHLLFTLREWLAQEWRFDRVLFGIAESNDRQARLLDGEGLAEVAAYTLQDGRRCVAWG